MLWNVSISSPGFDDQLAMTNWYTVPLFFRQLFAPPKVIGGRVSFFIDGICYLSAVNITQVLTASFLAPTITITNHPPGAAELWRCSVRATSRLPISKVAWLLHLAACEARTGGIRLGCIVWASNHCLGHGLVMFSSSVHQGAWNL